MKRLATSTIIIFLIIVLEDYVLFKLMAGFTERPRVSFMFGAVDILLKSVLFYLLLQNFFYNRFFDFKSSKVKIAMCLVLPLIVSVFISFRLEAINKIYLLTKSLPTQRNTGKLFSFDRELGWRLRPNSLGYYDYYIGDSIRGNIPIITDGLGFRTVPDSLKPKSDTVDLFLGCSYTFGDYIESVNGFVYLTAHELNHLFVNASASGYGFAQMQELMSRLTSEYKFKYVFLQLSPWLSKRAMDLRFPDLYSYTPVPYFSLNDDGFHTSPVSYAVTFSEENWQGTSSGYLERIRFLFAEGIRTQVYYFFKYQLAKMKIVLGMIPKPADDKIKLEKFFYDKMISASKATGAVPVILKIGYPRNECEELLSYLDSKATIIDLDEALNQYALKEKCKPKKLYSIYTVHKGDTIVFDPHPNELANTIISETILKQLSTIKN